VRTAPPLRVIPRNEAVVRALLGRCKSIKEPAGTFEFVDVPPGMYLLESNPTVDGKTRSGSATVTVSDSDLSGIVIEFKSPSQPGLPPQLVYTPLYVR
jgi:hypothetical protein